MRWRLSPSSSRNRPQRFGKRNATNIYQSQQRSKKERARHDNTSADQTILPIL
jgi:hypothetical protein